MGLYSQNLCTKNLSPSKENCKSYALKTDHSDPIFANLEFLKIDGN